VDIASREGSRLGLCGSWRCLPLGIWRDDAITSSYALDQYVCDLRTITAKETDPVRITDRVAPLARKFAQTPGWLRPEYRECDAEQGFGVHLLHEEPNHDLAVFVISWLPNRGTTPHNHKTWAVVVEINYEPAR
jgi:predicted metal-dependent enzyme (double-stranded beta helix superfamily)